MNYCGLICEYNPFHTGHLYQLNEIKKIPNLDAVICVMSGNFVQRAEPAIINKYIRTEITLNCGADAVIQIPTACTLTGGEKFAAGAIGILSGIKGLKYLAFGCETKNFKLLTNLAEIQAKENNLFKETLHANLKNGLPYTKALTNATLHVCSNLGYNESECAEVLTRPNNILAIEYLKAIYKNNYNIEPIFIHRVDNYNSKLLTGKFASATAIRDALIFDKADVIQEFLPYNAELITSNIVNYKLYDELILFSLRRIGKQQIEKLADCAEGIENRLYNNALRYTDINTVLEKTKTKRYTYTRLKRLCAQALLGITKNIVDEQPISYGKLLGIRKDLKHTLSDFNTHIIVKHKDMPDIISEKLKEIITIDSIADDIYAQLSNTTAGSFFKSRLIEI